MCDHFTRQLNSADSERKGQKVYGALFGVQNGLEAHIYDSFELIYTSELGEGVLDTEHLNTKKNQFSQVFPDYELLGWYATGKDPTEDDMLFHKKICEVTESPFFLLFEPKIVPGLKELPISLFESVLQVMNDVPTMTFVDVPYKIETAESELVTIDTMRDGDVFDEANGGPSSGLIVHLQNLRNSILMLRKRVDAIKTYVDKSKNGEIEKNHEMLRQISGLCNQLPIANSETFKEHFFMEYNDTLLLTYLASIMKGAAAMGDIMGKISMGRNNKNKSKRVES
mmetsp:Transcript_13043/g.15199  ORF Transcript_13043/g.15199 Transcript_13043/m.15199 type:complete len:283 (-) Transcript_13043:173-1021(-)